MDWQKVTKCGKWTENSNQIWQMDKNSNQIWQMDTKQ